MKKIEKDTTKACERLKKLGKRPASGDSRREVIRYLESSKQSVQYTAAQTLAAWGGRKSVDPLRYWLLLMLLTSRGRTMQGKAADLLARCVDSTDEGWVIGLFFDLKEHIAARDKIVPLVSCFKKSEALLAGLNRESQMATSLERIRALLFLGQMAVAGREAIFARSAADSDATVSRTALYFVKNPTAQHVPKMDQWARV